MKVTNNGAGSTDRLRDIGSAGGTGGVSQTKDRKGYSSPSVDTGVTDKVAISGRAKEAAKAKEVATNASDVNEEKIAKLRSAIQNGSYKVDAEKVADRLVEEHLNTIL